MEKRILLLTGKPGIGKTTLICKVAAQLQDLSFGGFYTEEIREFGRRQGFRLVTFDDERATIAHVNFDRRYQVGKYGVDVTVIDYFADSLAEDYKFYVIDEIGKMECLSQVFVSRIEWLMESNIPLIATVGKYGSGFIETVKQRPETELWEITHSNRDMLPAQVVEWLQKRLIEE